MAGNREDAVEEVQVIQSNQNYSPINTLDPRVKLLTSLSLISLIVTLPPGKWLAYAPFFIIILVLTILARLPLIKVLLKSVSLIPFVLVITVFLPFFKDGQVVFTGQFWIFHVNVTLDGIVAMITILIKTWLCFLSLIWLTATTAVTGLLGALQRLHFPAVMVMILSSMYRFIFVIIDETWRMKHARDSRLCGRSRLIQLRSLGNLIGTLFIRSYERSERVYAAMVARGFDGTLRTLNSPGLQKKDFAFSAVLGLALAVATFVSYWFFI